MTGISCSCPKLQHARLIAPTCMFRLVKTVAGRSHAVAGSGVFTCGTDEVEHVLDAVLHVRDYGTVRV
jgi:hypothetical protein